MKKKNNVIVIGSGFSGLASAITLAKSGKIVTVLEKHSTPGGNLRNFSKEKWVFDTGFNYLSSSNEHEYNILKDLTGNRVKFIEISSKFETIHFKDGSKYEIVSDKEKFISKLKNDFPTEINGLVHFFKEVEDVIENRLYILSHKLKTGFSHFISKVINKKKVGTFNDVTLMDLLTKYIRDEKLRIILSIHCEKLLLAPEDISFETYSILKHKYFYGGTVPVGNIGKITSALIEELKEHGGEIKYSSNVTKIKTEKGRAVGVILENGEELECDTVISNIGIIDTYENLIDSYQESKKYNQVKDILRPNRGYVTLYLGLHGDISDLNITKSNYRILGKNPFNMDSNPLLSTYTPEFVSITFPSLWSSENIDSQYHTCQIRVATNNKHFNNLSAEEQIKIDKIISDKLIEILESLFPGIEAYIKFSKLTTPVKDEFDKNRSINNFGISSNIDKVNETLLHPGSGIKQLYFTGVNSFAQDVTGSFLDGIITSSNVLKKNLVKSYS